MSVLCTCLMIVACGGLRSHGDQSLYQQLGGETVLRAVASDTVDTIADSAEGQRSFAQVKRPRVKARLFEFLCVTADGPCEYKGDDMARVHRGLGINEREWNALVEILRRTLAAHRVSQTASNRLLKRLAPLYRVIVTADASPASNTGHRI